MNWHEEPHYNGGKGIYRVTDRRDPHYPEGAYWDLQNMVYDRESDHPECMRGGTRLGVTAMGGTVTGLFDYDNGTRLVATCTDGKIYEYVSGDWAVASGARATGNSTTSTTRWTGTMFYGATSNLNLLILCNGVDAPVKYESSNGATALGGSPPSTGNFPCAWQGRLWVCSGSTLYYSAANNCEDWTTGGGGGNVVVYRGFDGSLSALAAFANNLIIFKRASTYRIAPTASFSDLSIIKNVSQEIGCVAHNTIVEEGGKYLTLLSERGVVSWTSSSISSGFSPHQIDRWVKPIIDTRNKLRTDIAFAVGNLDRREYWLHYPIGSATIPTEALVANFAKDSLPPRWTRCNIPNITAGCVYNDSNMDYFHYIADNAGKVYKIHVASQITIDGQSITGKIIEKFYTQGMPNYQKEYGYSFVDAEVDGSYAVTVTQQMYRPGLPQASANTSVISFSDENSEWGVGEWGVAYWGGTGNAGQRVRPASVRRASGMGHIIQSSRWFKHIGTTIASVMKQNTIAA